PYSLSYSPRSVQILLNELGYDVGTPDGVIGPRSRAAIRAFEADAGLPVTGEAGLDVFYALQKAVAARQGGTTAQPSGPAPAEAPVSTETIVNIQAKLRQRGYDVPSLTGVLDAPTVAAIRAYQADAGLPVTGQASASLLASLQAGGGSAPVQRQQVMAVQQALNERGYDAGPVDGTVGPKFRAAVRTFQADNGMPPTGELGPGLLAALGIGAGEGTPATAGTATAGTGTQVGAGTPVADNGGLSQEDALQLEQVLSSFGYDPGPVDGVFDSRTQAGIRAYQTAKGMPATGAVDDALITALNADIEAANAGTGTATTATTTTTTTTTPVTEATPEVVMQIEQALKTKGYRVGPVDGQVDPLTQRAISDFIRHAQLTLPDVPSPELLAAIQASDMTAKKGAQADLLRTGVGILNNFLSQP
ncbi:MAG: peptidoglycan-binding protein, partial [Rhodospirillaceae bacterium]|nr:peptidoglycan-binding protein [Rhodospirillaceae bacterium]